MGNCSARKNATSAIGHSTEHALDHQRQRPPTLDGACDPDSQELATLVELLQTYPGLLDAKVETVARALTQATLAASEASSIGAGSRQATPLQRIRMGRSLLPASLQEDALRPAQLTQQMAHAYGASAQSGCSGGSQPHAQTSAHSIRRARASSGRRWLTQQHLQQLQREGVVFTKGKFTDEENATIDEAIAIFVEAHGLSRQEMYDHLFRHKTLSDSEKHLRKIFWPILAEALPARQIQAIYHHVRRKYHPHNYQGTWTAGEDEELRRLVAAHGPAWEAISQQLGRMGTNCRDRWRYIQSSTRAQKQQPQRPNSLTETPADSSTAENGCGVGGDGSTEETASAAPISAP
ncbi:hypothetical protein BX070DRAFT_237674 [Coemansia spiralis]|nr:hypothetical protein BX070DRAFT_237674 [Coemansia spiralis]